MTKTLLLICAAGSLTYFLMAESAANDLDVSKRLDQARTVSNNLISGLGKRLQSEMSTNGPVAAISVCKEVAPEMANKASIENGWRVSRISQKPRNTMIGIADSWEQGVLKDFEHRIEAGESFETLEHFEIVDEPLGKSFRYVKALETKAVCLACHGDTERIPSAVEERLSSSYPHDRARGFKLGQLRGAISIKQPLQ